MPTWDKVSHVDVRDGAHAPSPATPELRQDQDHVGLTARTPAELHRGLEHPTALEVGYAFVIERERESVLAFRDADLRPAETFHRESHR